MRAASMGMCLGSRPRVAAGNGHSRGDKAEGLAVALLNAR